MSSFNNNMRRVYDSYARKYVEAGQNNTPADIIKARIEYPVWPPIPDPAPAPPPEPEPEPQPEPGPDPGPDDEPAPGGDIGDLLKKLFAGLIDALSGNDAPSQPYQAPPIEDFPLPPARRQSRSIRAIQPIPRMALPPAAPPVSAQLQERVYYQTLEALRNSENQRIQEQIARNAPRDTSRLIRGMTESHGPSALPSLPPLQAQQPTAYDDYQTLDERLALDPSVQQAFYNVVNPPSGAATPFIAEDPGWIQSNLAHTQRPLSPADQLRQRQAQAMAMEAQRAQINATRAQQEMYEAQARMLREQQYLLAQKPQMLDPGVQQNPAKRLFSEKAWYQKIQQQEVLSDSDLKQMFHDLDLKRYSANADDRDLARLAEADLKKQLAWNMSKGPNALRNRDKYIIIGDQAYGKNEAYQVALKDLDYFQKNDRHLPPLPYPIRSDLSRKFYPDVTKIMDQKLQQVINEVRQSIRDAHAKGKPGRDGWVTFYGNNFPNSARWDLQVGHGLPGQVPVREPRTGEYVIQDGKVQTTDQYALYKGHIVRAGYLSNYIYGYAIAGSGSYKGLGEFAAFIVNLTGGKSGDNPADTQAMREGFDAYWKEHADIKRQWYSY